MCIGLIILNLGLQIFLLFQVQRYIVNESVTHLQIQYEQFHAEVFDASGHFLEDVWDTWHGPKDELCNSALTRGIFTCTVPSIFFL